MLSPALQHDISVINQISAIPTILKLVAELTGMRVTLVARVTPDSWTACAVYDRMGFGLKVGDQLDVATTLCKEVCDLRQTIVIEHASKDPVYTTHRTPKLYNIESYIAIPIYDRDGSVFGTLCGIDHNTASLGPKVVTSLTLFTELIASQLAAEQNRRDIEQSLFRERKLSELREQFIAILGHDLRSPLAGIASGVDLLGELRDEPVPPDVLPGLQDSVQQMSHLINRTMDFARVKLGGGIDLAKARVPDLGALLQATIEEFRSANKTRQIVVEITAPLPAEVDAVRLRQVFTNLIGNALQHGVADAPVVVKLSRAGEFATFAVTNQAPALSDETLRAIFEPFRGAPGRKNNPGLGLGLYIASEIVKAHAGSIQVESAAGTVTFTALIPVLT